MLNRQRTSLAWGIGLGLLYGVVTFAVFRRLDALPSVGFLFLVPAVMGALPLLTSDEDQMRWYTRILFIPWLTLFSFALLLVLVFREGAACLFILALPLIGAALAGTFIAWLVGVGRIRSKKRKAATGVALLLLPLAFTAVEKRCLIHREVATTRSRITISAGAAQVWAQLAEVPTIQPGEYRPGFFAWLGVPQPIRATVDKAALGGHRVGEFEHGLRFDEQITAFDEGARMSFSIAVDPRGLRPASAERHAFEAGYFRFVDASYRLSEQPGAGAVQLELASTYVIESGVNWYGKLWARALVADFQDRVLEVIRGRSERRQLNVQR